METTETESMHRLLNRLAALRETVPDVDNYLIGSLALRVPGTFADVLDRLEAAQR